MIKIACELDEETQYEEGVIEGIKSDYIKEMRNNGT